MEQNLNFYQRKRKQLQEEIAEIDLAIETFEKLNEVDLFESFKKKKIKFERQLRTVIRKEKELE
nr:MAG TPA: hypothetical protein [Caudoviricetes sp.]